MAHSTKSQSLWPADKLEYAIRLAREGHKMAARDMLRRVVALQPVNQTAWLWLSALATSRAEAEAALEQARKINPAHPRLAQAEQWLAQHFAAEPRSSSLPSPTPSDPLPDPANIPLSHFDRLNKLSLGLILAALTIAAGVLFFGVLVQFRAMAQTTAVESRQPSSGLVSDYLVELEAARVARNWSRVIAILETLYQQQPDNQMIVRQLADAYLQRGIALRYKGFVEEALPLFEKTLAFNPDYVRAQQEYQLASDYLTGVQHYQAGRWAEAIEAFDAVRRRDRGYAHITDLLYSATYNHGLATQAAGNFAEARRAFESAIALRPDLPEPRLQLTNIEYALSPATPPATPLDAPAAEDQLIVVGIAEQRMLVFEKGEPLFDFVVSTGEPGRDTAIGEFEILNKIDMAYASTWNLDMPYWLGIYWAGPLQNGIHALPIVKHTGYKLWDGYLGQRVSYGCIILSDEDAAALYNWVAIGAKVKIVPSLTQWLADNPQFASKHVKS